MRELRVLILTVAVIFVLSVGATMADTVTINHAGGVLTGTLTTDGLTLTKQGDVTLYVTEDLSSGAPAPGCVNNKPTITATNKPATATVGGEISAQVTTSDLDGDAVSVTANRGSISGTTWQWTPTSTGTYSVTLTANDGGSCNNTASTSWSISVSSGDSGGTTDPSGAVLLTDGKESGNYFLPAKGTLYFKVNHGSVCSNQYRIKLIESGAKITSNGDMIIKKSSGGTESWPTFTDYQGIFAQYGYSSGIHTDGVFFSNMSGEYSGETLAIYKSYKAYPDLNQADTYYILIYNNSSTGTSIRMKPYCY